MKSTGSPTCLDFAIMGLLRPEPRSGYDIRRIFLETPMMRFSPSPGSVYPSLRRIVRRRHIKGTVERRNTLRPRQVFRLTQAGHSLFVNWLRRPLTRDDIVRRTDELDLRFAFMDGVLDISECVAFLTAYERELRSFADSLRSFLEARSEELSLHGSLCLELGIQKQEAHFKWARRARATLRRRAEKRRLAGV